MSPATSSLDSPPAFVFRVIRYTPSLVRDEWLNIGILLFDPYTGDLRLRLIETQEEFSRVRRLQRGADEEAIRHLRDHLEDRFISFLQGERQDRGEVDPGEALQALIDKWNATLSNGIQLGPPRGDYGEDIESELDRLYREQVAPPRVHAAAAGLETRVGMRGYCSQVWRQAGLWQKIQKSVRVDEFTFRGDPMRLDYSYQRNGTRGFVSTLSVSRSPRDCKELAYTAKRIASRIQSEFAVVTDVDLKADTERQKFVSETLIDAGIVPLHVGAFASWVPKLKPVLR